MTYNVVYWNRATEDVYDVIRSQMPSGWALITLQGDNKPGWLSQITDADLMIVADWAVTEETLAAAPKLKIVQHQGVGHERIDKETLKVRGVPLALCPAGTTIGVAEHTMDAEVRSRWFATSPQSELVALVGGPEAVHEVCQRSPMVAAFAITPSTQIDLTGI